MKKRFTSEDMKAAFIAGMEFERACEYRIQHPIIILSGHLVRNPKPNCEEFMRGMEFKNIKKQ